MNIFKSHSFGIANFTIYDHFIWAFHSSIEKKLIIHGDIFTDYNTSVLKLQLWKQKFPNLFDNEFFSFIFQTSLLKNNQLLSFHLIELIENKAFMFEKSQHNKMKPSLLVDILMTNGLYEKDTLIWCSLLVTHTIQQLVFFDNFYNFSSFSQIAEKFFNLSFIIEYYKDINKRNILLEHIHKQSTPFFEQLFLSFDLQQKNLKTNKKKSKI